MKVSPIVSPITSPDVLIDTLYLLVGLWLLISLQFSYIIAQTRSTKYVNS